MYHNEASLSSTGLASHEWSVDNLGEVFGVALDRDTNPNIYVTQTRAYGNASASGIVFKLDGATGVPSVFATLPNNNVGLGNIAYSDQHDQLYVTNLEDGKIYRYDLAGTLLSTFDPFLPDDGSPGFSPLEERIWGINFFNCRIYFGTWKEDFGRLGAPNEVWSVGLDATGDFVGPETLEVVLPDNVVNNFIGTLPIADIAFSKIGRMLIAERSMKGDTENTAHVSRVLEYDGGHLSWTPTINTFMLGTLATGSGFGQNSAGGVDYDCAVSDDCNSGGSVLATADALHLGFSPNYIYGIQILPDTGGDLSNSYIIDLDGGTNSGDKTQIGDVDSVKTCFAPTNQCFTDPPEPCLEIIRKSIECIGVDDNGNATFSYQITIQNITNETLHEAYFLLPNGKQANPGNIIFSPPVPPLGTVTLSTVISGGKPGEECCFRLSVHNEDFTECCVKEICVTVPCEVPCLEIIKKSIECIGFDDNGNATFSYQVTIQNLSNETLHEAYFLMPNGKQANPGNIIFSPPIPPLGTATLSTVISRGKPGEECCFRLSVHNEDLTECCVKEICVTVPCGDPTELPKSTVTENVVCNQRTGTGVATLTICNNGVSPKNYNWTINNLSASPSCPAELSVSDFTPSLGSIPVLGSSCEDINIVISDDRFTGFPPGTCANYGVSVEEPEAGHKFEDNGIVSSPLKRFIRRPFIRR